MLDVISPQYSHLFAGGTRTRKAALTASRRPSSLHVATVKLCWQQIEAVREMKASKRLSKAIIVVDWAYKGTKRKGHGTGRKGLSSTLKYLQYRDKVQNQLAENHDYERWQDRGMGLHWCDIMKNSDLLQSKHVLAWTWVISPAPDLMELVPEEQRRDLVCDLTERIVEDYYLERGYTIPEYSFILHDRQANMDDAGETMQQLHTHVVLPGTTSAGV